MGTIGTLLHFDVKTLPRVFHVNPPMTDEEFEALCRQNGDMRIEMSKEGAINMMSPTGGWTSIGNQEITSQLNQWWKQHRRGRIFDSNGGFVLPDGARASPDASYVSAGQWNALSEEEQRGFPPVCPVFVIELVSESDPLKAVQRKMEKVWMANGALLGWIIDPYRQQAIVYRPGRTPEPVTATELRGEEPVPGLVLDLSEVWAMYKK